MRAGKPPADGTEVYVLGKPALYEEKSEFQLVVSRMLPTSALGRQQQELERVRGRSCSRTDCSIPPASARSQPIPR